MSIDKLGQGLANGNNPTSFGSISRSFGTTNVDSIASSGGAAGYTTALGNKLGPLTAIPTDIPAGSTFDLKSGTIIPNPTDPRLNPPPATPAVPAATDTTPINPTNSGDLNSDLIDKAIALFGANFQAPSDASTSGSGVVVVPESSSDPTTAAASPVSPQMLGIAALGVVGFFVYRHFKGA